LEVETDLVILLTAVFKEVLDYIGQRPANHVFVQFLQQLSNHGLGSGLARLDSPTRKRPVAIFFQAVQQDRFPPNEDGSSSNLEFVTTEVERNHAL
jgi:hypothetical protein